MRHPQGRETVLVISDLQAPFYHRDTVAFLTALKAKYKPTVVINIGDEVDFHALSQHDHDPDGYSAGDELKKAIKSLSPIYKLFPVCKVVTSNHTARVFRRAYKFGIPQAVIRSYREILQAPQTWEWADSYEIDGVHYFHGEGFSGVTAHYKAAMIKGQSVVHGHLHSAAGISYLANEHRLTWGMNVGCLIDVHAYAFAYGKAMPNKPIIGTGVVIKGVPHFVPMCLDKRGRWNGEIH